MLAKRGKMRLLFHAEALKEFKRADSAIQAVFKKKLGKLLSGEELPSPAHALHGFPRGFYKIKLRKAGFRLVYQFDGKDLVILVIAVGRRDRDIVYEVARARLEGWT